MELNAHGRRDYENMLSLKEFCVFESSQTLTHLMVLAWVLGLSRGRQYLSHSDVDKSLVHSIPGKVARMPRHMGGGRVPGESLVLSQAASHRGSQKQSLQKSGDNGYRGSPFL